MTKDSWMVQLTNFPGFEYYTSEGENVSYGNPQGEEALAELEEDAKEMAEYTFFDDYQDFTDRTAIYPEDKGLEYTALGLASEAGEFAGKVKKWIRDGKKDNDALVAELGDCLWYLARAAAELDVYLSDVARVNREKLIDRSARNAIMGSGDDR